MPVKLKKPVRHFPPKASRTKVPKTKKEKIEEIRRLLLKRMEKKKKKELHKFFDRGTSGANPRRERKI